MATAGLTLADIMKVYGPYTRKDGRQHVVIIHGDGTRQTKSYPRYLLEQSLGRELTGDETVDHTDNNYENNNLSNLQILSRSDNAKKGMSIRKAEIAPFVCPTCNISFFKELRYVRHNNINHGKKGPFCSRSCAGFYGSQCQKLKLNTS